MPVRLLAFAASLRKDSWNRKLLTLAVEHARAAGADVVVRDFRDFVCPNYDFDLQQDGFPQPAIALAEQIGNVEGMLIASPEYNYSLPGTLKNVIDWVSRLKPMPLSGRWALLLSASTSLAAGTRGLWQLRIPLEGIGVFVYPGMFGVSQAQNAFDAKARFKDAALDQRLQKMVEAYVDVMKRATAQP